MPRYHNALLRVSAEQHPMVTAARDAEHSLTHPEVASGKRRASSNVEAGAA